VRNTRRAPHARDDAPGFSITTTPAPMRRRALEPLERIDMANTMMVEPCSNQLISSPLRSRFAQAMR
jgi:hypothetical protein